MFYEYFVILVCLFQVSDTLDLLDGWNYINLHCRDNDNQPVDWWFLYKPPSVEAPAFMKFGRNFTYITSNTAGHWKTSQWHITTNSMVQFTLSPLYRRTYVDHLAVLAYEDRNGTDGQDIGTSAHGVLMVDELAGLWMGHTVPGLIDLTKKRPEFPTHQAIHGHLIVCLSLDHITLNQIALALKAIVPTISSVRLPRRMKSHLPLWESLTNETETLVKGKKSIHSLEIRTKSTGMRAVMLARKPGDKKCIFEAFAKSKGLVVDVYGHREHKSKCENNYGVRNIKDIKMKSLEFGSYANHDLNHDRDRAGFAVSAPAALKTPNVVKQYWACINNFDDGHPLATLVVCVEHFGIWAHFENLKVKEPEC